jgi:hypothetical protein
MFIEVPVQDLGCDERDENPPLLHGWRVFFLA